jgi:DMSO/TMAO reductase YedYZ heme-binding membrane subunit
LLVHPILYAVFTYQTVNKIILFIIPRSDINPPGYEMFLTYGRIAFSLLTVGVIAGLLRNRPEIRAHWRKFHILNYFAFFFVSVHALNVGTDIKTPPFAWFFWVANFVILGVVLYRFLYPRIRSFIVERQTSRSSA